MTQALVFLPGMMGTELFLGTEKVWPPKFSEAIGTYNRIDKLMRDDLRVGVPIETVSGCYDIYRVLQGYFKELGFTPASANKKLIEFGYDWRKDLFKTAETFAQKMAGVTADDITIVAHSMGGLIARLALETEPFASQAWVAKVTLLITMATPHNGAPLALARCLGLDTAMGISKADFRKLASNKDYPSGYQLLPAPGEDACWDIDTTGRLGPYDIYDHDNATALGLIPDMVDQAKKLHLALDNGKPRPHIRTFYFAATGHQTVVRVNVPRLGPNTLGKPKKVMGEATGDGTVPLWSALPRRAQKHVVVNNHAHVFKGTSFKSVFFQLFGSNIGAVEAGATEFRISIDKPVYTLGEQDEVLGVALAALTPQEKFDFLLEIASIDENGKATGTRTAHVLRYEGPKVTSLSALLRLPEKPGLYRMSLRDPEGLSQPDEAGTVTFAVRKMETL